MAAMTSLESLAGLLRALYRAARYAGLVFVVLAVWFLGREVHGLWAWCHGIHPWAGVASLIAFAILFWLLLVRPALVYLRVPLAVRPPDLPALEGDQALALEHVRARARGVLRYVGNLRDNPNLAGARDAIDAVLRDGDALVASLASSSIALAEARERLVRFEHDRVEPLLKPLDDQAREIIRREAMAVAVATAVSPSGATDAFFVAWRNANLVARLAQLYYGRPGVRGTLLVLHDVSFAVFVAGQMQGLAEKGVQTVSGFLGRAASPFAGPLADGVVNGLVSMRIGYLAMRRCRAFRAFTERSVASFLQTAFREAAKQSAGLASDLVTKVGTPVLKVPVEAGKKIVDWVTESVRGWFGTKPGAEPAGTGG